LARPPGTGATPRRLFGTSRTARLCPNSSRRSRAERDKAGSFRWRPSRGPIRQPGLVAAMTAQEAMIPEPALHDARRRNAEAESKALRQVFGDDAELHASSSAPLAG